jgi:SAM-dependent methyltransferase
MTAGITAELDIETAPGPGRRKRWITEAQAAAIAQVPHFGNSEYRALDLNAVLDGYYYNFVEPLLKLNPNPRVVADVGAGYGWLSLAFALNTSARVIVVEYDPARLAAARAIAGILGVGGNMEWVTASVDALPLSDRSVDAVYCIEVLEHAGVQEACARELARISRDLLVVTTPNKVFPVIGHDTCLPFCHWLPLRVRDVYAAAFGRRALQHNNLFWSPRRLLRALPDFARVSRFMQFGSFEEYRRARQNLERRGGLAASCLAVYFAAVARFGGGSLSLLPNLAATFRRR